MKCAKCGKTLGQYASSTLCRRCNGPKSVKAAKLKKQEERQRHEARLQRPCIDCGQPVMRESRRCAVCAKARLNPKKVCAIPGCENLIAVTSNICRPCFMAQRSFAPFGQIIFGSTQEKSNATD